MFGYEFQKIITILFIGQIRFRIKKKTEKLFLKWNNIVGHSWRYLKLLIICNKLVSSKTKFDVNNYEMIDKSADTVS